MRLRSLIAVIAACGATSCGAVTEPSRIDVVLETEASVIQARQDTSIQIASGRPIVWLSMTVPLTIRNAGDRTIYFRPCGAKVLEQRQGDGTWHRAWSPICPAILSPPDSVVAGSEWRGDLRVMGARSGPGGPPFDAESVAGTYRIVLHATTSAAGLPVGSIEELRVSSRPFRVQQ